MERIPTPKISEFLYDFMEGYNLSGYKLAKDIHVPIYRIYNLLNNHGKMDVELSLRLAKYFGCSDLYFLRLQNDIDYRNAKMTLEKELDLIVPVHSPKNA